MLKWRNIWTIIACSLVFGCATTNQPIRQTAPPVPVPEPAMDTRQAVVLLSAPAPAVIKSINVTLAYEVETVDTNQAPGMLTGICANADLSSTNWQEIWTGPFPASTNTYPADIFPGAYWTSNYLATVTVILSNRTAAAGYYRAFWRWK